MIVQFATAQIEAARTRLDGLSMVSPPVACDAAPAHKTVRLKLENLQPIGSFKIRPIGNAVLARASRCPRLSANRVEAGDLIVSLPETQETSRMTVGRKRCCVEER
ncbi:MAG TPA: hypothetical protein VGD54_08350 [Steroidobacteraceae bacterium]